MPQHSRSLIGIGRSIQVTSLFQGLSVFENLRLALQALKPASGFIFWRSVPGQQALDERIGRVLRHIGLIEEVHTEVSELSHGQQRLLEVGMALMTNPRILLLNEPTSGMGIDDEPEMISLLPAYPVTCI